MSDHAREKVFDPLRYLGRLDLARVEQLASWQDWTRDQGEGRIVRHAEKVPRNLIHVRMRAGVPGRDPHVSLPQGTGE